MTESNPNSHLPKEVWAVPYENDLATLEKKEQFGTWLTCLLLIKLGETNPYKGCVVQIVEGPDKGKQFTADFGKPLRFEPMTVVLTSEIKP